MVRAHGTRSIPSPPPPLPLYTAYLTRGTAIPQRARHRCIGLRAGGLLGADVRSLQRAGRCDPRTTGLRARSGTGRGGDGQAVRGSAVPRRLRRAVGRNRRQVLRRAVRAGVRGRGTGRRECRVRRHGGGRHRDCATQHHSQRLGQPRGREWRVRAAAGPHQRAPTLCDGGREFPHLLDAAARRQRRGRVADRLRHGRRILGRWLALAVGSATDWPRCLGRGLRSRTWGFSSGARGEPV